MKFTDIPTHLTGFTTPLFGLNWNPPELDREVARRVITFLEDRRVLYSPFDLELPDYCARSGVEIRHYLTSELQKHPKDGDLGGTLRGMRVACRKFLDTVQAEEDILRHGVRSNSVSGWIFLSAIGELRGVMGLHIARLAVQYGIDVEDDLASILPAADIPVKGRQRGRLLEEDAFPDEE